MLIRIRTLTPIWTGDINGKCTKLRETSIIGSLRWWFEAIVRGLGGYACDSVGELTKKCELDYKKYKAGKDPKELICPVCYIFGTTNWARRFRLEISEESYEKTKMSLATNKLNCKYSKDVSWWIKKTVGLPCLVLSGDNIVFKIISSDRNINNILYIILKTIEKIGALGSHNSYGFGTIKVLNDCLYNDCLYNIDFLEELCGIWNVENLKVFDNKIKNRLPTIIGSFKLDFKLDTDLPNYNIGFLLKYTLRNKFKQEYEKDLAEKLFGSKKNSPRKFAGKIFVSNSWEENDSKYFRIYGMLKSEYKVGDKRVTREEILNKIEKFTKECIDVTIVEKLVIGSKDDFIKMIGDGR